MAGTEALTRISSLGKSRRLELLDQTSEALYGTGLLTRDQLADVKKSRRRDQLDVPEWAARPLGSHFGRAIEHLAPLEPEARVYTRDRMQVSLLPFYRGVAESLAR